MIRRILRSEVGAAVVGFLTCFVSVAQTPHYVWVCDTPDGSDCRFIDSSVMGGLRFDDYKVTNPTAVQFDPVQRQKELAVLKPSDADALCKSPPSFAVPAPTITFRSDSVQAKIFYRTPGASFSPSEFMDVQFADFAASNGYTSAEFGFRMTRGLAQDGSELPQYNIQLQAGNNGLENVPGLGSGVGFSIDPVGKNAVLFGTLPSSELLRQAILGTLVNAQSILKAAKFSVTNPAPAGKTLWSSTDLISLAGQAQPWILAAVDTRIPLGPPVNCRPTANGYGVCDGDGQINAFTNMILTWGGEYLGLRSQQSFNMLVDNLRFWATANAPTVDPAYAATANGLSSFESKKRSMATALVMLWPTLRNDPQLLPADRQIIENWLVNWLMPPFPAGPPMAPDYWPNDLGYWADDVLMADAIRRSDHAGFAFGVQRFYGALHQMRSDGSFPLAAMLSACSAAYSNTDLLHLVAIAEMAASQGYDLYAMSVDGKRLETAIEFLLNAYENPALLSQYSKAGGGICFEGNPGDPPDFSGFRGPALAWAEPYIARFPFSRNAARLRTILGPNVNAFPFPLMIDRFGMNATCAFRKPYEFQPITGVKVAIISGSGQTAAVNQPLPKPISVRVTDNSGKPVARALVSFAAVQGSANVAAPAQVLTDTTGMASANVTIGPNGGPIIVTATALGVEARFSIADGLNVPNCSYSLDYSGQAFGAQGGTGTITITTQASCPWTVGEVPAGVVLTSAGSGTDSGKITFEVLPNGGGYTFTSFTIADQTFTIEQSASSISGLRAAGSLAQVVSEGTWGFSLNAINLGNSPAATRFAFADNQGSPLALPLTFPQLPPAIAPELASTLDRTLNPNAQIVMESTGPDSVPTLVGSGQLLSNGNVSGFGIFSNPKAHWGAVAPVETRNASRYILAFDNTSPITTGVAVANLSVQAANVPVLIRDDKGVPIGNQVVPLSALGHTSFMLNDPQLGFPVTNNKRGTIEFDTPLGGQISVLGLRANGPALTTLPVLANVGTAGGSITHVAYNGGWTSVFYIVNTGNASAQFTLSFFDENGVALPAPLLLPQSGTNTTTSALTQTLAPGAILVVNTNEQDSPTPLVGSAQLTTTGNISGFEIFRWNTFNQEASVPLESRTPNSFVLVFDDTNGLTTGVALANLSGSAANITVTLRDDTGTPLPSMPINLPPRGHKSFMLPDPAWYPAAANKRGMAEFSVPQGVQISIIGLRANSDGTLTTIPVLTR